MKKCVFNQIDLHVLFCTRILNVDEIFETLPEGTTADVYFLCNLIAEGSCFSRKKTLERFENVKHTRAF